MSFQEIIDLHMSVVKVIFLAVVTTIIAVVIIAAMLYAINLAGTYGGIVGAIACGISIVYLAMMIVGIACKD